MSLVVTSSAAEMPEAKPLADLVHYSEADPNELLRCRYLCRGGGLLLVGPTGVGKSSFSLQCMLLWALGRPLFGLEPVSPLTSLLVQAENDEGDMAEMRDGVIRGWELTPEEATEAQSRIWVCREDMRVGEDFFASTVRPLLQRHHPDLLWIDPALAYLGGDTSSQSVVSDFLRNGLNPLVREFNCGVIIVHHTNKPPATRDKSMWAGGDFAYLGSGSAEWANWARAVLAIRNLGSRSVYELVAGKRGGRLRWVEEDNVTRTFSKYIAHDKEHGHICWRHATGEELDEVKADATGTRSGVSVEVKVLSKVPPVGSISKNELIRLCKRDGVGDRKARETIDGLVGRAQLHEWGLPRQNARPEMQIGRQPHVDASEPTISAPPSLPSSLQQENDKVGVGEPAVVDPG